MLNLILVASLWVCPGNMYTNEPREGCEPFHEEASDTFSAIPETPGFEGGPGAFIFGLPHPGSYRRVLPMIPRQSVRATGPLTCRLTASSVTPLARNTNGAKSFQSVEPSSS